MNKNTIQGNWNDIKGKIKTKWGKIADDEIEALKGNLDQLAGKIEKAYGRSRDQAESEYVEFKSSFQTNKEEIKQGMKNVAQAVESKVKQAANSATNTINTKVEKINNSLDASEKKQQRAAEKH